MVPARRDSILERIRKYFIENYDPNEEHLPSEIDVDIFLLRLKKEEKTNNDHPDAFDFSKVILTTLTRSNPSCCCLICEIARFNKIEQAECDL